MAGRNGVEGQTGWQEKWIISGFQKISLGIVPAVIFGITESVLVQRKLVIIFFRKREPVMTAEIAEAVHMAGIPHVSGTAC